MAAGHWRGWLSIGVWRVPCALGRCGIVARKREGDGASPRGTWAFESILYRADRVGRPRTRLPVRAIARDDGWADAVGEGNYNRGVKHPYRASAEKLWRDDAVYDVVVVLGYNRRPRVQGRGSAIFMHVARDGFTGTEGCVALRRADLLRVLAILRPGDRVRIGA